MSGLIALSRTEVRRTSRMGNEYQQHLVVCYMKENAEEESQCTARLLHRCFGKMTRFIHNVRTILINPRFLARVSLHRALDFTFDGAKPTAKLRPICEYCPVHQIRSVEFRQMRINSNEMSGQCSESHCIPGVRIFISKTGFRTEDHTMIFDTGSNGIDLPGDIHMMINKILGIWRIMQDDYVFDCGMLPFLPPIAFQIQGKRFQIMPRQYTKKTTNGKGTMCCTRFRNTTFNSPVGIVLGMSFLHSFQLIFDDHLDNCPRMFNIERNSSERCLGAPKNVMIFKATTAELVVCLFNHLPKYEHQTAHTQHTTSTVDLKICYNRMLNRICLIILALRNLERSKNERECIFQCKSDKHEFIWGNMITEFRCTLVHKIERSGFANTYRGP
ncbi:saccharopepsin [Clonorchis sinensis]|uniref:Saccharopepsin n=1 Tax=Clonorchis sinensis TaxID=79923 RepID=G7YU33_CLOSI|nr:saccharopepsin [Clonorchis sinensis]